MIRFRRPSTRAMVALLAGATVASGAGSPVAASPSDSAGRFIITVGDAYDSRAVAAEHRRKGAAIDYVYTSALNGFAGEMSHAELGELQRDRRVTRIERDGMATTSETQPDATWGLDRVDARSGLDRTYSYASAGTGVTAYIIDTGIRLSHSDFGGRAESGYDAVDGGSADDCNGHGTHVAGTVGGATYGVAKAAKLVAVRVLDCGGSGSWSGVIAGMDWVTGQHVTGTPAVANMSLGGGASTSVDDAVKRMIADGVTTVVAAGNGNQGGKEQDACNSSPARVAGAVTIGATTSSDAKTSWSNYGGCVDFFAPGASITSAWHTGDTAISTISGTSMAAPHAAGAAALHLEVNPGHTAVQVRDALYAATTKGIVTASRTASNHLLYVGPSTSTPPPNAAPTASFTHSCSELACSFTDTSDDSDGTIASRSWSFGDGGTSTDGNPTHTYGSGGTYTVTLTVTDDRGATGDTSTSVTVGTASSSGISLSASGYKVKGTQTVDLTWSGATGTDVDIFRNGSKIATAANEGAHTDNLGKGGGSYTYKVCQAGTSACSAEVSVSL